MLAILALLFEAPETAFESMRPSQIMGKMILKYLRSSQGSGHISMKLTAAGESVTTETDYQFQSISKVFLKQIGPKGTYLVVSDGTTFMYPKPGAVWGRDSFLYEPVALKSGLLDFRDIYTIGAFTLPDRAFPIDLVFGGNYDVRNRMVAFATVQDGGMADLNGIKVRKIVGNLQTQDKGPRYGQYAIYISTEFDLVRYAMTFPVQSKQNGKLSPTVQATYEYNLTKSDPNPDLFILPRRP